MRDILKEHNDYSCSVTVIIVVNIIAIFVLFLRLLVIHAITAVLPNIINTCMSWIDTPDSWIVRWKSSKYFVLFVVRSVFIATCYHTIMDTLFFAVLDAR